MGAAGYIAGGGPAQDPSSLAWTQLAPYPDAPPKPLSSVAVVAGADEQLPPTHACPAAQSMPQRPQWVVPLRSASQPLTALPSQSPRRADAPADARGAGRDVVGRRGARAAARAAVLRGLEASRSRWRGCRHSPRSPRCRCTRRRRPRRLAVAPERAAHGVVTVAPLSLQVTTEGAPGAQVGAAVGVHIQVEQGAPPAAPVQVAPAGQVTVLSERPSAAHRRTVVDVAQVALDGVQTVRRHASLTHLAARAGGRRPGEPVRRAHLPHGRRRAARAPGEQVTAQRPALHTSPPHKGPAPSPRRWPRSARRRSRCTASRQGRTPSARTRSRCTPGPSGRRSPRSPSRPRRTPRGAPWRRSARSPGCRSPQSRRPLRGSAGRSGRAPRRSRRPRMLHARSAPVAPQAVAPGVHAAIAQRPSIPQRRPAPQSPSRRHSTQAPRAVSHCCPTAQSIAPRQVVRVTQALARHI